MQKSILHKLPVRWNGVELTSFQRRSFFLSFIGMIFANFTAVLWGRIGFDSDSVVRCKHVEQCGESR